MLALYVDFNSRERFPDGGQAVFINTGRANPPALEEKLAVGMRVILYDEETRCEGILRRVKWADKLVADIIPETISSLTESEYQELCAATRRAGFRLAK